MWLGVVPYLSRKAVLATLSDIAGLSDSEVVFDYGQPVDAVPPERRAAYEAVMARAAAVGEPWLSLFYPSELHQELRALGFGTIEDAGFAEILGRYIPDSNPQRPSSGGRILRARL
jgi:O-methyltransferase involved in polyketide biosynthesis